MLWTKCIRGAIAVVLALTLAPTTVFAQAGAGTLRVAKGIASRDITVFVNRAIVLESAERFSEVSVANPAIADVAAFSDQTIYILGKSTGATTLTLLAEGGRLITNVTVRVTPDLSEFKQRLREVLPNEAIEVREANGGIILSGVVSGARKIDTAMRVAARYAGDNVSNLMNVGGTQQVQLKIRFAEMQRSTSKALGFNFSALGGTNNPNLSANTNQFLLNGNRSAAIVDPDGDGVADPNVFTDATGAFGIARLATNIGGLFLDVVLNALETKGAVKTLAEPNLVTLSGESAEFLAGGEIPVPVAGGDGEVTVTFRPFGISLNFTPTVIDEDVINLVLDTEVSALDAAAGSNINGIIISGFTTRRARTTVELRDGESMAIAGLLQEDFADNASQLPFLGDIPVLGTLFRSSDFQRSQSELVIIITPQLVTPTTGDQLALPTDRVRIPNEAELFLFGKIEGDRPASDVAGQGLDGSYGYILE